MRCGGGGGVSSADVLSLSVDVCSGASRRQMTGGRPTDGNITRVCGH